MNLNWRFRRKKIGKHFKGLLAFLCLIKLKSTYLRDRETERQRDRETERQRDRETERDRERQTERQMKTKNGQRDKKV